MDIIFVPALQLLRAVVGLLVWIILADVLMSWLLAANIFNIHNRVVYTIISAISGISDFMLNPVRRRIPVQIGALDISPVIVILLLKFLEGVTERIIMRFLI
jgi:YggT family protein